MRRTLLSLVTASCMTLATCSLPALADEFSDTYGSFQQAVSEGNYKQALKLAERAYHLGVKKFGDDNPNTEALIYNYGNMLVLNHQFTDAISVFKEVERRYEERYGKKSPEMFSLYMEILDALDALDMKTERLFREDHVWYLVDVIQYMPSAIRDMKDTDWAIELFYQGALAIKAADYLPVKVGTIVEYMEDAVALMSRELPADDDRLIKVRFIQSDYLRESGDEEKAVAQLNSIIKTFEAKEQPDNPMAILSHGRLVALFEEMDAPEKATAHCVAIGKMQPWADNQAAEPVYRIEADYPYNYAKLQKEGSAVIAFDIDKQGFVRNATVKGSDGGKLFGEAAKKAVEKWRYAPRFVDGQAVDAPGQQTNYTFSIRRFGR